MSAVKKTQRITIEDYLSGELVSSVKHEYLGGYVYAMAGSSNAHGMISVNVLGSLHAQLRSKRCRPFNSDTKIQISLPTHTRFYYPDVSIVCRPNPQTDSFQSAPVVVVEVLSRSTRRLDEGEKLEAYLTIPSLAVYMLIEQDEPLIRVWRRVGNEFQQELYDALDAVIELPEIEATLPLSSVYEMVEFVPEVVDDADS